MWEATKEKRNMCKRDVAGTVALSFFHYIYQGMIFVIQVVRFIMCLLSLASAVFFFFGQIMQTEPGNCLVDIMSL